MLLLRAYLESFYYSFRNSRIIFTHSSFNSSTHSLIYACKVRKKSKQKKSKRIPFPYHERWILRRRIQSARSSSSSTCVREWAQYATRGRVLQKSVYRIPGTLDVTSPRTIRKNTDRRESYEGDIELTHHAIVRVHVYAPSTIFLRCNPSVPYPFPSLRRQTDLFLPETRARDSALFLPEKRFRHACLCTFVKHTYTHLRKIYTEIYTI